VPPHAPSQTSRAQCAHHCCGSRCRMYRSAVCGHCGSSFVSSWPSDALWLNVVMMLWCWLSLLMTSLMASLFFVSMLWLYLDPMLAVMCMIHTQYYLAVYYSWCSSMNRISYWCLLLLLVSVKYLVKNFLTEYVRFSYPALSVVASLIICLHVCCPVTIWYQTEL
jgi:hypothetical protein